MNLLFAGEEAYCIEEYILWAGQLQAEMILDILTPDWVGDKTPWGDMAEGVGCGRGRIPGVHGAPLLPTHSRYNQRGAQPVHGQGELPHHHGC